MKWIEAKHLQLLGIVFLGISSIALYAWAFCISWEATIIALIAAILGQLYNREYAYWKERRSKKKGIPQ